MSMRIEHIPENKSSAQFFFFWHFIVLALLPIPAWADHLEQVVTVMCEPVNDQLIIEHHEAYDRAGDRLVQRLGPNQWNIRQLMGTPRGTQKILQTCQLGQIQYRVTITGVSWGEYGQEQTAHVMITKGDKAVFDQDLQGTTFTDKARPAISRIVVTQGIDALQISITSAKSY